MTADSGNEMVPAPGPMSTQPAAAAPHQQVLLALGAMYITATHVHTPAGPIALASSHVSFLDQTRTTTKIPTWAIVLTVITVWFFLLGLLFLLAKEQRTEGYVSITVQDREGRAYTEHVRVASMAHRDQVIAQAQWLQQLASSAGWRAAQS